MMRDYEPFVTETTAMAIKAMGRELHKSYEGVSKEVVDFCNSFRVVDTPLLVAALEPLIASMKANFDKYQETIYYLATRPGATVVITGRRMMGGAGDEES